MPLRLAGRRSTCGRVHLASRSYMAARAAICKISPNMHMPYEAPS